MSATGSSGSLLERYAGIRSAVNAIQTRLIGSLTGPSNRALRTCSTHWTGETGEAGAGGSWTMEVWLIEVGWGEFEAIR